MTPGRADFPSHLRARGAMFRRRHRLYGPFCCTAAGSIPGKGCEELIEYFSGYVKEGGDATLALMGAKLMALPEEPPSASRGCSPIASAFRRSRRPRSSPAHHPTKAFR